MGSLSRAGVTFVTFVLACIPLLSLPRLPAALAVQPGSGDAAIRDPLDQLLAEFRAMPGLFARYREEKRILLLAQPLTSEGTVHYAPPRQMARHTRTPSPSSVVFDGTTLRFGDGTSEQRIDIGESPVVRAFVEGFLDVLAGDREGLERMFVVDFHATDALPSSRKWDLSLVPRDAALRAILGEVRFSGEGVVVSRMRIREANGDEGVTTFSDVDTAHRYSAAEASHVFRVARAGGAN
jgi:outer membrane lipoprotein-sorting protein